VLSMGGLRLIATKLATASGALVEQDIYIYMRR